MVKQRLLSIFSHRAGGKSSLLPDRKVMLALCLVVCQVFAMGAASAQNKTKITGTVTDQNGKKLIGVSVYPKNNMTEGGSTNIEGAYTISVSNLNDVLVFSYVGMQTTEVKMKPGITVYNAKLNDATQIEKVTVNAGIVVRDKTGFTGSYSTFNQEELKSVGRVNVLQSLKTLDPSFVIVDNDFAGSDPNVMANIELRGKSALTVIQDDASTTSNANMPLFMIDGFEASLREVNDLDMNRVESITILKDAGSTAIFGSKGGNGVIVIETIKPKEGELMITYNGDIQVAWADLSSYNMMNAREKLEFEKQAKLYGEDPTIPSKTTHDFFEKYYEKLRLVERGQDTYWLKYPLRTGINHGHSLSIGGGGEKVTYQLAANYRNNQGVMKGSGRETAGTSIRVSYRHSNFNVSNLLSVSGVTGKDGAWTTGNAFSDFANANPYYIPYDDEGVLMKFLAQQRFGAGFFTNQKEYAANPLYNAHLNSMKNDKSFSFSNKLGLEWRPIKNLRLNSNLELYRATNHNKQYIDARHTKYYTTPADQKGEYSSSHGNTWKYAANFSATYSMLLNEAHTISLTGRASVEERHNWGDSYSVRGFSEGVDAVASYGSFVDKSTPGYSDNLSRGTSFMGILHYNFKQRYLFDFNINSDGTTTFGRNNPFTTNWAVGLGWNIYKEAFAENWDWMDELKLRGSYGTNGNQNVTIVNSTIYKYNSSPNVFGQSSFLSEYANRDLDWMKVTKISAGIDLTLLKKKLQLNFDVYESKTDPMVIPLPLPPSSGQSTLSTNLGYMKTRGLEFKASYRVWSDATKNALFSVRATGSMTKSKYGGMGDVFKSINKKLLDGGSDLSILKGETTEKLANQLIRYRDDANPDAFWAVRSLGIDPATGREVFLTKDGVPSFVYNKEDEIEYKARSPKMQGVITLTFNYKKLKTSFNFRYYINGYRLNNALYNKVENITEATLMYNQDKRALYDRWQAPGDVARFKAIKLIVDNNEKTYMSTRFIQRESYFKGEGFRISWDCSDYNWVKAARMKDLEVGVSMTDIFEISTIKAERGYSYPFQRAVSFTLSTRF